MSRALQLPAVAGAMLLGLCWADAARADDQQLVADYLQSRGAAGGAVIRPVTDDFVARTFSGISFFGVIFRQYPVAMACPQAPDLKCANVFLVRSGQVEVIPTLDDLKFFFEAELTQAPSQDRATDAASTWLRLSQELKQDLFYTFSAPDISYNPFDDATRVRGRVSVTAGGEGRIDVVMIFGTAGTLLQIDEKNALRQGIRPICQATRLLDRDAVVRRMAEQDLLVMGRAARPYLDHVRATARPKLRDAIDRVWQRIVSEGR